MLLKIGEAILHTVNTKANAYTVVQEAKEGQLQDVTITMVDQLPLNAVSSPILAQIFHVLDGTVQE